MSRSAHTDPPSGQNTPDDAVLPAPLSQLCHTEVLIRPVMHDHSEAVQIERPAELPRIPGYEILDVLGEGGMGVVYRARHLGLNRVVAIKTLTREAMLDEDSYERFQREANAVAALQHPNIIQVFAVGTYPVREGSIYQKPYLSLEYVSGGSLLSYTRTPQDPKQVARWLEIIARAAHFAHLGGLVHRDLKPGNVLLSTDGTPKIADFGLAKPIEASAAAGTESLTKAGVLIGTPEYMAPELLTGISTLPSVDIYAMGVILYELLTGRVPFKGATSAETLVQLQVLEPVPPRRFNPSCPRDLETICLKCLEKSAARRYETAEELADELGRWLRGETIQARPATAMERGYRWTRRNPTIAVLICLIVFGTASSFLALLFAYGVAEKNTAIALAAQRDLELQTSAERRERYHASCLVASSALQLFNAPTARSALDDAPVEFRNWEWNYFRSQTDTSEGEIYKSMPLSAYRKVKGSDFWILGGGWTSDNHIFNLRTSTFVRKEAFDSSTTRISENIGRTLYATQVEREPIHVRRMETGEIVTRIDCDSSNTKALSISSDDRWLIINLDTGFELWDLRPCRLHKRFIRTPEKMVVINICKDFTKAVVKIEGSGPDESRFAIYDLLTDNLSVLEGHFAGLDFCRFNADGTRLLTSCQFPNMNPTLWNAVSGKIVAKLGGHTNLIRAAEFSPDGRKLVTGSLDHSIRVWNGMDGESINVIKVHRGWITDIDFNPDGSRFVASSEDQTISVWETKTGEERARLLGHSVGVWYASFTTDGKGLVSVSNTGNVRTWNVQKFELEHGIRGHKNFVYSVDHHPTRPIFLSSSWDGTARLWDSNTGEQLDLFDHGRDVVVNHVRFHPNGKWFMTICRTNHAQLWDLGSRKIIKSWSFISDDWRDGRGSFSPDGSLFAMGGRHPYVIKIHEDSLPERLADQSKFISDMAFSTSGDLLVAAIDDENNPASLQFWSTKDLKPIDFDLPDLRDNRFTRLAFHPSGRILMASTHAGKIFVIDTDKKCLLGSIDNGVGIYDMVFSQGGSRLAVACANNLVRIWDTSQSKLMAELSGHVNYVHAVAFSPGGDLLISGSGDKTIRFWRADGFHAKPAEAGLR